MPSTPGAGDTPALNATLTSRVIRVRFCRENPIPKYFISAAAGTRKGDDESHGPRRAKSRPTRRVPSVFSGPPPTLALPPIHTFTGHNTHVWSHRLGAYSASPQHRSSCDGQREGSIKGSSDGGIQLVVYSPYTRLRQRLPRRRRIGKGNCDDGRSSDLPARSLISVYDRGPWVTSNGSPRGPFVAAYAVRPHGRRDYGPLPSPSCRPRPPPSWLVESELCRDSELSVWVSVCSM